MKIYWNVAQGTEEWESLRYGKIGGTRSDMLLKNSDAKYIELLSEHTEIYQPDYDSYMNDAMQRGHELEPKARELVSKYVGVEFIEAGWIDCGLIGISPDGITEDLRFMCELKCLGAKKHTEVILSPEILADYLPQCIHYFTVNPTLEKLYFAAYRPEHKYLPLVVRELTLEGLVNIGTKAKPNYVTVAMCVERAKAEAELLAEKLKKDIDNMKF